MTAEPESPSPPLAGRPLAVGVVGGSARAAVWLDAVARTDGVRLAGVAGESADEVDALAAPRGARPFANATALASEADAVLVASPAAVRARDAADVLEQGAHVLVAWPPAASVSEAERLADRAEESGVRALAERPLPSGPLVAALPAGWAARLVHLDLVGDGGDLAGGWTRRLAGALDLCTTLCRSHDVARLDAEADRSGGRIRTALLAVRFTSGAYAQVALRDGSLGQPPGVRLAAAGASGRVAATSLAGPACVEIDGSRAEPPALTDASAVGALFDAIAGRRRPPGALSLDLARDTMALVARTLERLR